MLLGLKISVQEGPSAKLLESCSCPEVLKLILTIESFLFYWNYQNGDRIIIEYFKEILFEESAILHEIFSC